MLKLPQNTRSSQREQASKPDLGMDLKIGLLQKQRSLSFCRPPAKRSKGSAMDQARKDSDLFAVRDSALINDD